VVEGSESAVADVAACEAAGMVLAGAPAAPVNAGAYSRARVDEVRDAEEFGVRKMPATSLRRLWARATAACAIVFASRSTHVGRVCSRM